MRDITTKHNGICIIESYKNTFTKRYASFRGRANRDEFSAFLLVYSMFSLFFYILHSFFSLAWVEEFRKAILSNDKDVMVRCIKSIDMRIFCWLVLVGLLKLLQLLHVIPLICLLIRRAHDLDTSGWGVVGAWALLGSSPLLSSILLAVLCFLQGASEPNQYGFPPAKKDELTLSNYLLVGLLVSGLVVGL